MLFSDPVATAPGTDLLQVHHLTFEARQIGALQRLEIITRICSDLGILLFDFFQGTQLQKPFVENIKVNHRCDPTNGAHK